MKLANKVIDMHEVKDKGWKKIISDFAKEYVDKKELIAELGYAVQSATGSKTTTAQMTFINKMSDKELKKRLKLIVKHYYDDDTIEGGSLDVQRAYVKKHLYKGM